jgi:transposase
MSNESTLFDLPEQAEDQNSTESGIGKPRLKIPVRNQVEMLMGSLEDSIPEDHKVRSVWDFVTQLDLSLVLSKIKSVESRAGAPAIDPRILLALWLYAFIEGICSARMINRYCKEHLAFKWLCGGVSVNEHTISDFRTGHGEAFYDVLTQSIGILSHEGIISIERVAQDGMKVKANAGKGSFRREKTLKQHLKEAESYVKELQKEIAANPAAVSLRQTTARKRAANERVQKVKNAINQLKKHRAERAASLKKTHNTLSETDRQKMRASETDSEARVMKMPDSGFAPAYNVQFATETKSKAILGVQVVQQVNDYGQLAPMQKQLFRRYGVLAPQVLADPGFLDYSDVEEVSRHSQVYIPSDRIRETEDQSEVLLEMKRRMETPEAKEIYKERAATAEFVNARTRTRGLEQFLVSGLAKVNVVATLFAIGQNMMVWMSNQ